MTRMFVCLITLVLLLGVVASAPLAAQDNDVYTVQPGDNLWRLAGYHLGDKTLWEQVYKDNPFLKEPGRRFQKNGFVYVLIRPGEKLVGLEKLNIVATMTPVEQLHLYQPPPAAYPVATTPVWVWWPLGLAVLALIVAYLIDRMLRKNPATSGRPIVAGGASPDAAEILFQQTAAQRYRNQTGLTVPAQQFTILRQVAGRIWGVMNVLYANGRSVPRQLNGERAYEAVVRLPNGTEETLYMLQACGNDLRYGGISRYLPGPAFRFEADPTPAAVPQPAPAPAEPAPAPAPAPVPVAEPPAAPAPAPAPSDGTISFEFKRATADQPNLVRLQGIATEEFSFSVGPNGTTLRYREVAAANK